MVQSVETSNDMSHLQLLLCIFQQGDEGPLGAFGQLVRGHTDVQPVLPKHGFPVGTGAPQTCSRKSDLCGLVLPSPNWCWLGNCIFVFIGVLSIDLKVRRDILDTPRKCPLGTPNLRGRHQTRCRGPASEQLVEVVLTPPSRSLSNIEESLFSIMISLIFGFDFSLAVTGSSIRVSLVEVNQAIKAW